MMTRKTYIEVANAIAALPTPENKYAMIRVFVDVFAKDNPRFDVERFKKACMVTE